MMTRQKNILLKKGADGWRGIIHEQFSIEESSSIALAIALELRHRYGEGPIFLSHDGRFYSKESAEAIAALLVKSGFRVTFAGMIPTPVASYAIKDGRHIGAILVTASHNPFYWNGIKLKVPPGAPPSKELELAIEARRAIGNNPENTSPGVISRVHESITINNFIKQVISVFDHDVIESIKKAKLKVVVEGLHGVAGETFGRLVSALGCESILLGGVADPLFNGQQPDPMCLASRKRIQEFIKKNSVDLGVITDGDGDRLCIMDRQGEFVWPHDMLAMILLHLLREPTSAQHIAVTVPTGSIVRRIAEKNKLTVLETPVGFKHMSPMLQQGNTLLGGGAVGEFACLASGADRDPFYGLIILLYALSQSKKSLDVIIKDLHQEYGKSCYQQWTFHTRQDSDLLFLSKKILEKASLLSGVSKTSSLDGEKFYFGDVYWVLFRKATTESGLRVYAELCSGDELERLEKSIQDIIKEVKHA